MFDSMRAIVDSMFNQIQTLERMRLLAKLDGKFQSMPSLAIAPNLNVSGLIEQVGKNSTEVGTVLLSEGSPVAVIFSAKQYTLVDGIMKLIPSVIQSMSDTLNLRIEFKKELQQITVKLYDTAGDFLHILPMMIVFGTVATVAGVFFLGRRDQTVKNNQAKPSLTMSYIAPYIIFAVGIGTLAVSAYGAYRVSSTFLSVAKSLDSIPA